MIKTEVSCTSLCLVKDQVHLERLADIKDGLLHTPFQSDRLDNNYENRDLLYRKAGTEMPGTVGIWNWTATPNLKNPNKVHVRSYYVKDAIPVRIVVVKSPSLEDLVEQLKNGVVHIQPYFCDTLFCYELHGNQLSGVLCHANEFKISDAYAKLCDDVHALPNYMIQISDVYNCDDPNLRFLKKLQLSTPSGYISIGNAEEIIRALILERSTWPLFKECIGATKAEWRNSKILLERICGESLHEAVVQKLKCTPNKAKQAVADFVKHANVFIEVGDIDAEVLAQIAIHHDKLRQQCEEALSQKWREAHAAEITEAEREAKAAKQRLCDVEKAVSSAEERRDGLLSEIVTAQSKLDQLLSEIDQYETLGKDTLAAVRAKIATAQKDMAGFIADLFAFLPQPSATPSLGKRDSLWQYACTSECLYSDDDIELAENWSDEFNVISQNISHSLSVEPEFCTILTAFLYAAHINNVPILIAGPGGCDMVEVLSVSIYASGAGQLTLGNECDYNVADRIKGYNEPIISIQNMFGKGWSDMLPQAFTKLGKQVVWTHPYVEDMVIEPNGIYNYMLPILSECFVGSISALDPWPGKRADNFKSYVSKKKQPLRITAFKRLGLSKLLLNQLEFVLSDAKAILDNSVKNKDMEILCGLLPLSVLTGRIDVLKEVIETENGISNSIKAEVARYVGEE